MRKALFVINPSAGRQNITEQIEKIIARLVLQKIVNHIDVEYTKKPGDAREAVVHLSKHAYDFVAVIGGDGTIKDVIAGIAEGESEIPIAIISAGIVNDFANYLHLPDDANAFCKMIQRFKLKEIDVGTSNGKIFMNVVAGGVATHISYHVSSEMKAVLGKAAYYVEGIKEIPKQIFSPFPLRVESEECTIEGEYLLFLVMNSKNVAGYQQIAPRASISDGELDVLLLKKVELPQMTNLLIKFLKGEHIKHPAVQYFQTKHIRIASGDGREISVDCDGEYSGNLPVDIRVMQKKIKVIVPERAKKS